MTLFCEMSYSLYHVKQVVLLGKTTCFGTFLTILAIVKQLVLLCKFPGEGLARHWTTSGQALHDIRPVTGRHPVRHCMTSGQALDDIQSGTA